MALTNDDISKISNAFSVIIDEKIENLESKINHLPTKEEYYKREDQMMGKLKKIEEELTVLSDHSSSHSDRIEKLEKIHPKNAHYATV